MRYIFTLLFALICAGCFAQDQLFKKDNSKLDVKVLEVTPTEVKYKLTANPDGPLYTVLKSEVALIIYKNGEHEAFKDAPPPQPPVSPYYGPLSRPVIIDTISRSPSRREKHFNEMIKHSNVIFINSLDFMNSSAGFSYFREFFQGRMDVHIPVSMSFAPPIASQQYNTLNSVPIGISSDNVLRKDIDAAIGVYANTSGKRAVTHFIGPMVRYLQLSGTCFIYEPYSSYYPQKSDVYNFTYRQLQLLINNGFLYRITPRFNIMLNAALGVAVSRDYSTSNPMAHAYYFPDTNIQIAMQLGLSFGYRF